MQYCVKKESFNTDGKQFHQYQQNKQLPQTLNHRKKKKRDHDIWYTDGNPGPGLGMYINVVKLRSQLSHYW